MSVDLKVEHDPARTSYYVDEAFYREVIAAFADWQRDERAISDPIERDRFRMYLEEEARLLDQDRLEDWLKLFAPECLYWMPGTPSGGDPRREVAIAFDDRRRMEDRVFRLRTGYAWSQKPKSRTVRLVANVEVFSTDRADIRMVRSNVQITEFRGFETRCLWGWCGYRYVEHGGRWLIAARQLNLIDCDQNLRNPSVVL
jgi:3-phenylpropionate/cinnamic acid dioxygenase small subunit